MSVKATCALDICEKTARSNGPGALCEMHYYRLRRYGSVDVVRTASPYDNDHMARFLSHVRKSDDPSGCWQWTASLQVNGYGNFRAPGVSNAHRFAYIQWVGPIAEGLQIDHLCRNRACVNPSHLEAVTPRVNTLRGESPSAHQARQTHCLRGHELAGENLYVRPGTNKRHCHACMKAHAKAYNLIRKPRDQRKKPLGLSRL